MRSTLFLALFTFVVSQDVAAFDPNCMWGADDPLCAASRAQRRWQGESRGNRSGGIDDERISNPDAGDYPGEIIGEIEGELRRDLDPRFANPYSFEYDPLKDPCLLQAGCSLAAKQIAHTNWLGAQCDKGNERACQKLRQGLSPGYKGPSPDPFPGVAPGGSDSWSLGGGLSPDGY